MPTPTPTPPPSPVSYIACTSFAKRTLAGAPVLDANGNFIIFQIGDTLAVPTDLAANVAAPLIAARVLIPAA